MLSHPAVDEHLARLVADGTELGIQLAAYVDGKLALDTWAGVADDETGRMVDGETIFTIYSATKGIVATAIHLLVERGKLRYDAPIAEYWPEFAANGKGAITLRHALSHQAGIPRLPAGTSRLATTDWNQISDNRAPLCGFDHAPRAARLRGKTRSRGNGRLLA